MAQVLAPALGFPVDPKAAADARGVLVAALQTLETVWLNGKAPFLAGNLQPSIADLSLACELMQVELLGPTEKDELLLPVSRVRAWLAATEAATAPHFAETHKLLRRAAEKARERREQTSQSGAGSSESMEGSSNTSAKARL
eukprot:TRINITY_DN4078_c0_g2_i1.p2 TRINITY_DN4078_c0_g2~~TRINITY_DN4078_c0_g2_i1.p2  ORF type:complete len:142 (+),score=29.53 TRINITY_DN4078_c0_g2_i1:715-1140(+)